MASGSGWNLWVWLAGGGCGWNLCVASGCGCKEVYRYPHITYPYSSCICSFLQQHPYFLSILKMFFIPVIIRSECLKKRHCVPVPSYLSLNESLSLKC